jgi:hypothetical protein
MWFGRLLRNQRASDAVNKQTNVSSNSRTKQAADSRKFTNLKFTNFKTQASAIFDFCLRRAGLKPFEVTTLRRRSLPFAIGPRRPKAI